MDQVLDFDNNGVSRDLGKIADSMDKWEGLVADHLDLTSADVVDIKTRHPGEHKLQA